MVFIVDDSKALRGQLVKMLSEIKGIKITGQAQNVAEAIEGIRNLRPEVVILDIQMPDGTGIEVLRAIRQDDYSVMVVMLTNHLDFHYEKKCRALGADYFLNKMRDINKLKEIVKNHWEQNGAKDS